MMENEICSVTMRLNRAQLDMGNGLEEKVIAGIGLRMFDYDHVITIVMEYQEDHLFTLYEALDRLKTAAHDAVGQRLKERRYDETP